ncbi:MAG: HDIG domain-containing protein [Bacteroidaceae bacterium]|nr:HDIG domain-containing protein [Bacteroidaceae bacterium]
MIRFNHIHKLTGRDILYRVALVLAATALLVLCMPRESYTTYQYRLGEPWDESPVIAQDSFPVYKPEATLERERDSLRRYYEPYFQMNAEVGEKQCNAFKETFVQNLQTAGVPEYYMNHLVRKFTTVYAQGIMDASDYDRLQSDEVTNIRVFRQNEAGTRSLKGIYTPKTAYEYLMAEKDSTRYSYSLLQQCNLDRFLQENLIYDAVKSQQQQQEVDNLLVRFMGQVQAGQKIVDRGDLVDEYTFNVLRSMERYQQERSRSSREQVSLIGGQALFTCLLMVLLLLYFLQFRGDYAFNISYVLLTLSLYTVFPLITYAMMRHHLMSVYLVPYCILPIFMRIFMDSRTAFITHVLMLLACAIALHHPFEFLATQMVAGLVAIYSLRQLSQRAELFRAAGLVTLAALCTYLCIDLVQGNFFRINGVDRWTYIYICLAGGLSLIAYLLLIPIERIFGFTSSVTLVELSNTNNPVLQRLSEEAPGTFQHSMQVANLAAEAAKRIGGNSQLVRTAALYHDIGKMENPAFFIENQNGVNPHEGLPFEQSAQIIIRHVADGIRLAERYKLPPVIKNFILTHHGRSLTRYFYVSEKNLHPDREVDTTPFTYPGPNPTTLEQAILMMADAVEAASRSLTEYTEESVGALVEKIINIQVSEGYFNECPITFLNIQEVKEVLKAKLKTIYHTRIQYPEMAEKAADNEAQQDAP